MRKQQGYKDTKKGIIVQGINCKKEKKERAKGRKGEIRTCHGISVPNSD
jgi:hypothetical protein